MKILCLVQRYHPVLGGSENLTKIFVDSISKKYEVEVCTTDVNKIDGFWDNTTQKLSLETKYDYPVKRYSVTPSSEISFDSNVKQMPLLKNFPGPFIPKLWSDLVLDPINYDLIFVTAFPYDHVLPAYVAAKKWDIPIVMVPLIHQTFPDLFLTSYKINMLNQSDAVIVLTNSEKSILEEFGVKSKIFVTEPTLKINSKKTNLDFHDFCSIPSDSKIILFIGLKSEMKGVINLIESMKKLWKKNVGIFLVMIGQSTQKFDDYIKKQKKQFTEKIIDLNIVDEDIKNSAYAECDIFALPSNSESFGLTYLEAWAYKKPVIGCSIPSTIDIIDDKINGLLVDFGNTDQLFDSIEFLINNPDLSRQYGIEGFNKMQKSQKNNINKKWEEICEYIKNNFKKR